MTDYEGYEPIKLEPEQKFEALRMRYEDHVELLRVMTGLDFRIFGGAMTIQLAVGAWLAASPLTERWALGGILLLDAALLFFAAVLLRHNRLRRKEAIDTLKNVMAALGFYRMDFYLKGTAINASGKTRFWGPWYTLGLVVALLGLAAVSIATQP